MVQLTNKTVACNILTISICIIYMYIYLCKVLSKRLQNRINNNSATGKKTVKIIMLLSVFEISGIKLKLPSPQKFGYIPSLVRLILSFGQPDYMMKEEKGNVQAIFSIFFLCLATIFVRLFFFCVCLCAGFFAGIRREIFGPKHICVFRLCEG